MSRKTKRIWKGTLAGLAGGLAGTFAMTQFQKLWKGSNSGGGEDPATVTAALRLLHISDKRKNAAGEIVHYSFGTLNGAAYGALAEVSPTARACAGTLFGAALFLAVDEGIVPLLGWSKPPRAYPLSAHAYGLASHLVYGVTTDAVRRGVRLAMR